jgi:hypothetical protein
MAKRVDREEDKAVVALDRLNESVQNLFILQAVAGGAKVKDVRAFLRVDEHRVNSVSKLIPRARGKNDGNGL